MPRKRRNKLVVKPDDETEDTDTGLKNTKPTRTLRRRQVVGQPAVEILKKPTLYVSKKERSDGDDDDEDNYNDVNYDNNDGNNDELKIVKTKISLRRGKLRDPLPSKLESNIIMQKKKVDKKKGEVQLDMPKNTPRCRNDRSDYMLKNHENETSSSNYDADSENDVKKSTAEPRSTKYKTNVSFGLKKCIAKKNIQKDDNIHFIKAECCQLRSEVLLSPKSSSSLESDNTSDNILEKNNGLRQKINYAKVKNFQTDIVSLINHPKNKENLTPRDPYSTPTVARKLDDSLFGFNSIITPLPFSPVIGDISSINGTCNTFVPDSKLTLHKRGFENEKLGFDDMPIQIPKKRQRKKAIKQITVSKDILEDLRLQFEEVETHELVVE